ncbi:MAG: hypothetical protein KDD06_18445, partial [Phaeodactylibacter sp.]|nr:hypothetical protein [Phaeodactylibacter sp.]
AGKEQGHESGYAGKIAPRKGAGERVRGSGKWEVCPVEVRQGANSEHRNTDTPKSEIRIVNTRTTSKKHQRDIK